MDQADINKVLLSCKVQRRLKKYASLNSHKNSHRNPMNMILYKNIFRLIDRLIFASHELFVRPWGFLYVRDAERRVSLQIDNL